MKSLIVWPEQKWAEHLKTLKLRNIIGTEVVFVYGEDLKPIYLDSDLSANLFFDTEYNELTLFIKLQDYFFTAKAALAANSQKISSSISDHHVGWIILDKVEA